MTKKTTIFTLLAACLIAPANADDNCRESMDIAEELALDGISEIAVAAGAGKLVVTGQPTLTTAQLEGMACASDEDDLKEISLETQREGSTLVIRTIIPKSMTRMLGNSYARLDLEVQVPNHLPVRIDDGSGSLVVNGVASVEIEDGSGSIQVADVAGAVKISDDGSGSITIVNAGSVYIGEDGSGSIKAAQITNDVYVGRDGSGSITAKDVGGSFTVVSDGSGSISHSNVAGQVQIDD
ncbi:MAG: DUF2807 domain-containing protein [Pseudomonadota bacterium]